MTAKEYLMQLWRLDRTIEIKRRELAKLEEEIGIPAMPDNQDRVIGSGYPQDPVADSTIQRIQMAEHLQRLLRIYTSLKATISDQIEGMENETYRDILICRYILMMTWEDVARTMKYTDRQCYRIHGRALQEFDKLYRQTRCQ